MLHLRIIRDENHTRIRGEFAKNPMLWVAFLALRISSIAVFALSGLIAWYKYNLGYNFNVQLFVMFGMVSLWFGLYLLSESVKMRGRKQRAELVDFVDSIAA